MSGQPIYNPVIPCVEAIPSGVYPGRMVRVQGNTPPGAQRFAINLQCGPNTDPRDDIALHLNFRFVEMCVVRNNLSNLNWGQEEISGGMPLVPGQPFEALLLCEPQSIKVALNGVHFCEFPHRIPYQRISHMTVDGDVIVQFIGFEGAAAPPPGGAYMMPPPKDPIPASPVLRYPSAMQQQQPPQYGAPPSYGAPAYGAPQGGYGYAAPPQSFSSPYGGMQPGLQPGMQRRGMGTGAAVGLGVGALAAGGLAGYALGGGFSSGDSPREEVPPFTATEPSDYLEAPEVPPADQDYIESAPVQAESDDYLEQEAETEGYPPPQEQPYGYPPQGYPPGGYGYPQQQRPGSQTAAAATGCLAGCGACACCLSCLPCLAGLCGDCGDGMYGDQGGYGGYDQEQGWGQAAVAPPSGQPTSLADDYADIDV